MRDSGGINTPAQGDSLCVNRDTRRHEDMHVDTQAATKSANSHLVTVKPLPNNMSIRRNTKKLTENSNFPGDRK